MKKVSMIVLALATMTLGLVQASESPAQNKETHLSADEQAFTLKLSETHRALFSAMTQEQKVAAMTASSEPDQAVEQAIQALPADAQR